MTSAVQRLRSWCLGKRGQTFWLLFGLLVYAFWAWVITDSSYEARVVFDQVFDFPAKNAFGQDIHRIAMVGDSLCLDDAPRKNLILRLQAHHPARVWVPIDACHGGSNVSEINGRVHHDVLRKPGVEAIFLFYDSDASDLYRYEGHGNGQRTDPPSLAVKTLYMNNLRRLIASFKSVTSNIVVAGPTIHGERMRGLNPMDRIYDEFMHMNANVSYFPPGWDNVVVRKEEGGSGGYITSDGEHENDLGHKVVLDAFTDVLLNRFFPGEDDLREDRPR